MNTIKTSKVSIVMPIYNSEEHLTNSIESILTQNYRNLEVILVDDGSEDNSREIILKSKNKDSRIKFIFQENKGAPTARNMGKDISSGDFIYFMDSDDYLPQGAIEKMINASNKYQSDLVMGQFKSINAAGSVLEKSSFGEEINMQSNLRTKKKKLSLLNPLPGNKMYKASLIKDNNISFADVRIAQDLNFYLKALLFAKNPIVIPDLVYYYSLHSGSISHSYNSRILDVIKSIEDVESFYEENNYYEKEFFNNIKFSHYSFQLSKVPQIENAAERLNSLSTFNEELSKIPKQDLYITIIETLYYRTRLKLIFRKLYTSNLYSKLQKNKFPD